MATTAPANVVDQTILITILVIAGVLFIALLGWAIYSTRYGKKDGEDAEPKSHHHHHAEKHEKKSSGKRRKSHESETMYGKLV